MKTFREDFQRIGRALRKPAGFMELEIEFDSFGPEAQARIRALAQKFKSQRKRLNRKRDKQRDAYLANSLWAICPWHAFICGIHIGSAGSRAEAIKRIRQNWNYNARDKFPFNKPSDWWATITYNPNGPDGK